MLIASWYPLFIVSSSSSPSLCASHFSRPAPDANLFAVNFIFYSLKLFNLFVWIQFHKIILRRFFFSHSHVVLLMFRKMVHCDIRWNTNRCTSVQTIPAVKWNLWGFEGTSGPNSLPSFWHRRSRVIKFRTPSALVVLRKLKNVQLFSIFFLQRYNCDRATLLTQLLLESEKYKLP